MQLQRMPGKVHKAMDKLVRACVWGKGEGKKGVHLVGWDVLCKMKERGGLGLKRADEMNKALLAKLAWRVATQGNETWAKVIKGKYG